jgi:cytochrome P450
LANWANERLVHTPNALAAATAKARGSGEQMPFLDAVVQETLRVRPPIVLVGRLTRQPLTLGEHHFPPDTPIVPVIQCVHRQPDLLLAGP